MEENIKEFEQVRKEVEKLVKTFPETYRSKILLDKWSLKDIVGHLSNWMVHDIDCFICLKKGVEPHWELSFDEFNEKGVMARKEWSWEKVIDEFDHLGLELASLYKTLPDDLWDVPIWNGFGLTVRKFLLKDIEHQKEHLGDLKDKLQKCLLSDTVTQ